MFSFENTLQIYPEKLKSGKRKNLLKFDLNSPFCVIHNSYSYFSFLPFQHLHRWTDLFKRLFIHVSTLIIFHEPKFLSSVSSIGVGTEESLNLAELAQVSSLPQQENLNWFRSPDFDALANIRDIIIEESCAVAASEFWYYWIMAD